MWKKILIALASLTLLFFLGSGVFLFLLYRELPDVKLLKVWRPPEASVVYDYRGRYYGDIGIQRRYYVSLEELPQHLINAFIAAEDKNFYSHSGVDIPSVIRAAIKNIKHRKIVEGASTITQQLARNLFLTRKRNFKRKLKEALLAIKIEKELSKKEILELYLNQIYLGNGAYGVEAAAKVYFNKHAKELSLEEAALLAGLPKAPSKFNPFLHPELAKNRRNYVLKRMYEDGYITYEEYETAIKKEVVVDQENRYRGSDYFLDMVKSYLIKKYGDEVFRGGFSVYTTVDKDLQVYARRALRKRLASIAKLHGFPFLPESNRQMEEFFRKQKINLKPGSVLVARVKDIKGKTVLLELPKGAVLKADRPELPMKRGDYFFVKVVAKGRAKVMPDLQGALVSMEVHTGEIRSLIGGYSYYRSPFNRVIQAKRQPGSAIKPVIYLSAIMKGFTQISTIDASPRSFFDISTGKEWTPKNYHNEEYGIVTLREALAKSINTAAVNLLDDLGFEIVLKVGDKLGLKSLKPYYSLALGSVEVTPLELTSAYQTFADLGVRCKPFFIKKVVDKYGNVLEENQPECETVLPAPEVRVLVDMLRAVVLEGTGRRAASLPRIVAGKTGTTNDYVDAWFVGFSPYVVTGVWVGFDTRKSLGNRMAGSVAALPIWVDYMRVAASKYPNDDFPMPEGVVEVLINRKDYVRADDTCPGTPMVFIEGTEPRLTCSDMRGIFFP